MRQFGNQDADENPLRQQERCSACRGAGVIGTPGRPCPVCSDRQRIDWIKENMRLTAEIERLERERERDERYTRPADITPEAMTADLIRERRERWVRWASEGSREVCIDIRTAIAFCDAERQRDEAIAILQRAAISRCHCATPASECWVCAARRLLNQPETGRGV